MGLISVILLGAFTLLYLGKSWQGRPEFVGNAIAFLERNIDTLAMIGAVYGFIAMCMAPIRMADPAGMFIHLLANLTLFIMALPLCFGRLDAWLSGKVNDAIMGEIRGFIDTLRAREKMIGYAGAVMTLILFGIVFR